MSARPIVETRGDRKELVADAGYRQLSLTSVFAGVFAAYGAFVVLTGLAAGVLNATDAGIDVSAPWRDLGTAGGIVVAGLLLAAYLFGGYVAGRMARRAGVLHGACAFVLGVAVAAGAAALARWLGGPEVASGNLRELGVPTTLEEWRDIATVAGVASLAAMLVGALAGAVLGERWHSKLLARALDPQIGAEAEARRAAERREAEAEDLRGSAFRRVRATTPGRTRRVDGEAETVAIDRARVPERDIDEGRPSAAEPWDPSRNGAAKESRANDVVDRAAEDPVATGRRTGR